MIYPRLSSETQQLLRRVVPRHERANLVNAVIGTSLQVDLQIIIQLRVTTRRSDASDLHSIGMCSKGLQFSVP